MLIVIVLVLVFVIESQSYDAIMYVPQRWAGQLRTAQVSVLEVGTHMENNLHKRVGPGPNSRTMHAPRISCQHSICSWRCSLGVWV